MTNAGQTLDQIRLEIAQVQNQMYTLLTSEANFNESEYQRLESQLKKLKWKYLKKFENQTYPKLRQA